MVATAPTSTYVDSSISELVRALRDHAEVGSQTHAEIDGALRAKLIIHLAEAIDKHERTAARLSNQILVLNIVLGVFTVVGTVLTIIVFVQAG